MIRVIRIDNTYFMASGRLIAIWSNNVPLSVVELLTNCEYSWLDINTCMLGLDNKSTLKSPKITHNNISVSAVIGTDGKR